jgi:long-chain acyl-CoA synthetase
LPNRHSPNLEFIPNSIDITNKNIYTIFNGSDLSKVNIKEEEMNDRPWVQHYDEGVPDTIEYQEIPLFVLLEEAAKNYPDAPCTIFKGARITYKEMNERTDRLAAGLAALGVKKGDRVGIFMPNTPQFVLAYFGIIKAGGIVVATNPLYSKREIEYQVNDSSVEVMIVMSNFYNTIKEIQPKTEIRQLVVTNIKEALPPVLGFLFGLTQEKKSGFRVELAEGDIWLQDLINQHSPDERPSLEIGADDMVLFQYSGGTTGIPKAAIALHRNLVSNTQQMYVWVTDLKDGKEVFLMAIPLFHVYGMVAGMCWAIKSAAAMVMIPNPRDLKDVLESIQKYGVSIYPGVPTMYNAINNHPDVQAGKYNLSTIRACISGSAPLLRETKDKFEALTGGKLVEGYGLSETPTATHCNPLYGYNPPGSIGLPFPDIECRIVSLEDEVTVLDVDEIGELVIKGPQVMKGYHNMPKTATFTLSIVRRRSSSRADSRSGRAQLKKPSLRTPKCLKWVWRESPIHTAAKPLKHGWCSNRMNRLLKTRSRIGAASDWLNLRDPPMSSSATNCPRQWSARSCAANWSPRKRRRPNPNS